MRDEHKYDWEDIERSRSHQVRLPSDNGVCKKMLVIVCCIGLCVWIAAIAGVISWLK